MCRHRAMRVRDFPDGFQSNRAGGRALTQMLLPQMAPSLACENSKRYFECERMFR